MDEMVVACGLKVALDEKASLFFALVAPSLSLGNGGGGMPAYGFAFVLVAEFSSFVLLFLFLLPDQLGSFGPDIGEVLACTEPRFIGPGGGISTCCE